MKNQISAVFFALGKRSGCFCWLRFFFGRSGFDAWLAQNGGGSNAYTAEEQTVFYASVSGKAVLKKWMIGLDHFLEIGLYESIILAKKKEFDDQECGMNDMQRYIHIIVYYLIIYSIFCIIWLNIHTAKCSCTRTF